MFQPSSERTLGILLRETAGEPNVQHLTSLCPLHTDVDRAIGAFAALGVDPANMTVSYLIRTGTERDSGGFSGALNASLHNYTVDFQDIPPATQGWR